MKSKEMAVGCEEGEEGGKQHTEHHGRQPGDGQSVAAEMSSA